ncbi:cytoplasmic FMR1 interacting protein, partial [Schistosoma bovis]
MEVLQHLRGPIPTTMREVSALSQLNLDEDVPSIQGANFPILLQSNTDTNFSDITAFKSAFARSAEDARVYSHLNTLLEQGQEYAIMLYTWRSISRALPFIRSSDQPNRIKIYEKTKEILEPHCLKLKQFMFFQDAAIRRFVEEVKRLAHKDQKNFFVNQAYLVTLGKMIKMFALLDEMKNMKASMKNDYSNYKRAAQFLQVNDPDSHDVSIFLAKQKIIRDTLKESLIAIDGYEDLLIEIIHNSAQMYENKVYILPEEKHTHVIVIAFSLYLLDSGRIVDGKQVGVCLNKIAKRLNIGKLDRILKECEVVNLFGDMSVEPFSYVRQTASFDPSKWPECNSAKVSGQGVILTHMARFQEEYTSLTSDLAWHTNTTSIRLNERSAKENQELYDLALRGLQYLSGWSVQVLDTFSWKLAHCASGFTNHECPKDAENYEKATRYNYNSEERFAMIEIISMIKSVQTQLLRLEACYSEAIGRSVYRELQSIVVGQLSAPLLKAQKKKERIMLARLILAIQATCADQCCDLSQLWYREFFLEMTNGACIQFPIEMSLPWIFTDHILESEHPGYTEYLLYMLDLYNDAADCALNRFRRRFLYEEIEAEANLVFDQLVYKLSDKIFRHYKRYASSILLDKRFRAEAQRTASWREPYPPPNRYTAALLRQRNIQLLGRSVDINRLICQRMTKAIYKSIEVAISRFHSSDITGIIYSTITLDHELISFRVKASNLKNSYSLPLTIDCRPNSSNMKVVYRLA